jgi:hypothetical protein
MSLTVLMPVTRDWTRDAVCAAIAASDIPRDQAIIVFDKIGCDGSCWMRDFTRMGFRVTACWTEEPGSPPSDRMARRVRHASMREFTTRLVPDGELLILDDDTLVPTDVYARLKAAGPHATGIQVSRWGNALCGVYRDDMALATGVGVESVDKCGHYCLLTTGEMYRRTATHTPDECYMQPIPGLKADWDCVCGHLTESGVLMPGGSGESDSERKLTERAARWKREGAGAPSRPQSALKYPVNLAKIIKPFEFGGRTWRGGDPVDRNTAIAMKAAGILTDARIV